MKITTLEIERVSRTLLWLSLSFTLIGTPIGMARIFKAESTKAELIRREAASLAEKRVLDEATRNSKGPIRLKLDDLKAYPNQMGSVGSSGGTFGQLMVTNATPKEGILCIEGIAKNDKTEKEVRSIPVCVQIKAYESNMKITFKFVDNPLYKICPDGSNCVVNAVDIGE